MVCRLCSQLGLSQVLPVVDLLAQALTFLHELIEGLLPGRKTSFIQAMVFQMPGLVRLALAQGLDLLVTRSQKVQPHGLVGDLLHCQLAGQV